MNLKKMSTDLLCGLMFLIFLASGTNLEGTLDEEKVKEVKKTSMDNSKKATFRNKSFMSIGAISSPCIKLLKADVEKAAAKETQEEAVKTAESTSNKLKTAQAELAAQKAVRVEAKENKAAAEKASLAKDARNKAEATLDNGIKAALIRVSGTNPKAILNKELNATLRDLVTQITKASTMDSDFIDNSTAAIIDACDAAISATDPDALMIFASKLEEVLGSRNCFANVATVADLVAVLKVLTAKIKLAYLKNCLGFTRKTLSFSESVLARVWNDFNVSAKNAAADAYYAATVAENVYTTSTEANVIEKALLVAKTKVLDAVKHLNKAKEDLEQNIKDESKNTLVEKITEVLGKTKETLEQIRQALCKEEFSTQTETLVKLHNAICNAAQLFFSKNLVDKYQKDVAGTSIKSNMVLFCEDLKNSLRFDSFPPNEKERTYEIKMKVVTALEKCLNNLSKENFSAALAELEELTRIFDKHEKIEKFARNKKIAIVAVIIGTVGLGLVGAYNYIFNKPTEPAEEEAEDGNEEAINL